jgi:hypothetical protein
VPAAVNIAVQVVVTAHVAPTATMLAPHAATPYVAPPPPPPPAEMDSAEVLLANMAPRGQRWSNSRNTTALSLMSSETASIARSTSLNPSRPDEGVTSSIFSSSCSGLILPLSTRD